MIAKVAHIDGSYVVVQMEDDNCVQLRSFHRYNPSHLLGFIVYHFHSRATKKQREWWSQVHSTVPLPCETDKDDFTAPFLESPYRQD